MVIVTAIVPLLQTRRVMLALNSLFDTVAAGMDSASGLLNCSGYTDANSGGVPANFQHYFYMTIGGGAAVRRDESAPCLPVSLPLFSTHCVVHSTHSTPGTPHPLTRPLIRSRTGSLMLCCGWQGDKPLNPVNVDTTSDSGARWAAFDFDPSDANTDTIIVRIATSLISPEQAVVTHAAEVCYPAPLAAPSLPL
jgi:hypothetical protein